jgi:hypothetical protein
VLLVLAALLVLPEPAQAEAPAPRPDSAAADPSRPILIEPRSDSVEVSRISIPDSTLVPHGQGAGGGRSVLRDSLRLRFEVGATSDISDEQFYEDVVDSVLTTNRLGRRLVSAPEARTAAVASGLLQGTRSRGAARYALRGEWSEGDLLRRASLELDWRNALLPGWRVSFAPRAQYRRDRTFDRELEEWRAGANARLRRAGQVGTVELGVSGDVLRSAGRDEVLLPDRDAAAASLAFERHTLVGGDWRIAALLARRTYPDSMERNHFEPGWEARWRRDFASGALGLETEGRRRTTGGRASTSGDDFWDERGALEGEWSTGAGLWRARLEGEAIQYDREDTTLFFDYQIVRATLGPRFQPAPSWSFGLGPRVEWFLSPQDPGERYRELAGQVELEWLGGGAWWELAPAAGWRAYEPGARSDDADLGLHSSYGFGELQVFGDQAVSGRWHVRALAQARAEFHTDSAENARSLYFSLDVRKIF